MFTLNYFFFVFALQMEEQKTDSASENDLSKRVEAIEEALEAIAPSIIHIVEEDRYLHNTFIAFSMILIIAILIIAIGLVEWLIETYYCVL